MNENVKLWITIGANAVVAIGLLVGLYFPMAKIGIKPFAGANSLRTQIETLEKDLKAAKDKIAQIPKVQEDLRRLEPTQKLATQLLPREKSPYELERAIRTKADETGIALNQIKPAQTAGGAGPVLAIGGSRGGASTKAYEEWNFAIDTVGTCDQLGAFINKMEEFEILVDGKPESRFFAVKNITLSAALGGMAETDAGAEGDKLKNRHQCGLTMVTYRYTGETEAPGKTAGPGKK
jgi:hypothetical protein